MLVVLKKPQEVLISAYGISGASTSFPGFGAFPGRFLAAQPDRHPLSLHGLPFRVRQMPECLRYIHFEHAGMNSLACFVFKLLDAFGLLMAKSVAGHPSCAAVHMTQERDIKYPFKQFAMFCSFPCPQQCSLSLALSSCPLHFLSWPVHCLSVLDFGSWGDTPFLLAIFVGFTVFTYALIL